MRTYYYEDSKKFTQLLKSKLSFPFTYCYEKIHCCLCLILTGCYTGIYIPKYTTYNVVNRQEFLGYVGDFEKIEFMENDHILVYTSFNNHSSNKTNSYAMRVRIPSKYNLMQDVRLSSKYFGEFPVKNKTKSVSKTEFDEITMGVSCRAQSRCFGYPQFKLKLKLISRKSPFPFWESILEEGTITAQKIQ